MINRCMQMNNRYIYCAVLIMLNAGCSTNGDVQESYTNSHESRIVERTLLQEEADVMPEDGYADDAVSTKQYLNPAMRANGISNN
jgi:PBP1b-binding outer membrane lipoprotein LpoB